MTREELIVARRKLREYACTLGLCYLCSRFAKADGLVKCQACRERMRRAQRRYYQKHKTAKNSIASGA